MRLLNRFFKNKSAAKAPKNGVFTISKVGATHFPDAELDDDTAFVVSAALTELTLDDRTKKKLRKLLLTLATNQHSGFFAIRPHEIGDAEATEWLLRAAINCLPQDSGLLSQLIARLTTSGKVEICTNVLNNYLRFNPDAATVVVEKLHLDANANKREHIEADLLRVSDRLLDSPQLAQRAIALLQSIGESSMRLQLCRNAADKYPNQPRFLLGQAICLAELNQTQACDRIFEDICNRFRGTPEIVAVARQFMRRDQYETAITLLSEHIGYAPQALKILFVAAQIEAYVSDDNIAAAEAVVANRVPTDEDAQGIWQIALIYRSQGDDKKALRHLKQFEKLLDGKKMPSAAELLRLQLECSDQTSNVIEAVPVSSPLKGVCVMISQNLTNSLIWQGLTMAELRKEGYASIVLEENNLRAMPTGDPDIDRFHGCICRSQVRFKGEPTGPAKLRNRWKIDLDAEIIEVNGLNLFQPIRERVSTIQRRYSVDFQDVRAQEVIEEMIQKADVAVSVFEDLRATLEPKGLRVLFLGVMSHYVPSAVYKKMCAMTSETANFAYVAFLVAYQHYYTVMGNTHSTALSVKNLTKTKVRMPHKPTRQEFLDWIEGLDDPETHIERAKQLTTADRGRIQESTERSEALEKIISHRANGGSVVCLFGKLTYDIGADREGGPGHKDMADWVHHSVEAVRGKDDVLLLIKPHPNELRRELNRPVEFFFDLLPESLPSNVMRLDHRWFNNNDLIPLTDLGTIWHGTAILELMLMKVPILACSWTGMNDNPIKPLAPKSREDYAMSLSSPKQFKVTDEDALHAALTIAYMGSDELMIPYEYAHMPFLRGVKGDKPTHWFPEKLEQYLKEGDPNIEKLAKRLI